MNKNNLIEIREINKIHFESKFVNVIESMEKYGEKIRSVTFVGKRKATDFLSYDQSQVISYGQQFRIFGKILIVVEYC